MAKLGLNHIVITSVDRDDLDDGGAAHFAEVDPRAIRAAAPNTTIEVLTPDFLRKDGALEMVVDGHARRVQPQPRDRAAALPEDPPRRALLPLPAPAAAGEGARPDACSPSPASWSGLGEDRDEVLQVMDDLRSADVDFLTIGQYLQPTRKHAAVDRFVTPEEFKAYETIALAKGFLMVSSIAADPLVLPRRRRLRAPEGRPARRARLRCCHAPGAGDRHIGSRQEHVCPRAGRRTGLPLIHLDKEFWRPGWTTTPLPEWRAKVEALAARDAWIMDGNYGATLDLRLPRADAVIWFDYLRLRCLRQIAWRIATTYGRVRPDLAPGCPEQIDLEFLRFV